MEQWGGRPTSTWASPAATPELLTAREREVAGLVTRAAADREIARRLGISPRTVQKHRQQIHRRLGLTSRAELMVRLAGPRGG